MFGSLGAFNYYLSGSVLANALGIENPLPERRALHDKTRQSKAFGSLSYFTDDATRFGLMFGDYVGRFQILNNPNQAPAFSLDGVSNAAAGSSTIAVNYGIRFDKVSAFIDEQQWSPRVNVAYKVSAATALHAGYSRYFTSPPQELAAQSSIDLYANTTNAPGVPVSSNVRAERTHYLDVGISHKVNAKLTLSADAYYKNIKNMLGEGQFGQALILSPFNYEKGVAKGLEVSAMYAEKTGASM